MAYGEAIDISFSIDVSTVPPGSTDAFQTFLEMGDTVDATGTTWEYLFISDDPVWKVSTSGVLGDSTTPTTHSARGYSTRLFDPYNGNYTWLWSDQNDEIVWTLKNLVLLDGTTFSLTLGLFLNAPETFAFDLTESPVGIPEPATAPLMLLGLSMLSAALRFRRRA